MLARQVLYHLIHSTSPHSFLYREQISIFSCWQTVGIPPFLVFMNKFAEWLALAFSPTLYLIWKNTFGHMQSGITVMCNELKGNQA
jgi:hypothetical protein